ncbi:MAG: penicillin acylase family protein, partial [Myxococcota bacterium]
MSVSDGPRAENGSPGLGQLGVRLLVGALLLIALSLLLQRWGEADRRDRAAFATHSGTIRISELTAPIEILRDAHGISHLRATRELDGWFGLGFVHGQDRLAQMVWMRRRAYGRSAEIAGEEALTADRLARLLEIGRASEAAVTKLPGSSQAVLESYAAGVNARISRIRQGLVRLPRWLREPADSLENWRPADSLAVVKLLSWCMGGTLETTLVLDGLIQRLDSVSARPFFPGGSSIDFGVAGALPDPGQVQPRESGLHRLAESQPTRALCRGIGTPSGGGWVIGGTASASGAPILVADWHLEPSVPALFYEAQIEAGYLWVAGVTIPGSPIVWAGRNRSVAWAGVPASAPVANLFIETLREDRAEYQNDSVWVPLEERQEVLRVRDVRGGLQQLPLRIRRTHHGPLIETLFEQRPSGSAPSETPKQIHRAARALAWTGARPGDGLTSMLAVLRAGDADALVSALALHHEPVLAVLFADRKGAGGVQIAGWLPKRPLPTGLVPVQGRLRSFDWRERVPQSELPAERLSASGSPAWVIAADQPWPTRGGLDQMEWLWRPGERTARIRSALERHRREAKIDLRVASELLKDDVAPRASRVVAAILGLARSGGRLPREALEIALLLERWDASMSADSAGAAAYHLLIEHLLEALLREPFGDALFDHY